MKKIMLIKKDSKMVCLKLLSSFNKKPSFDSLNIKKLILCFKLFLHRL